MGAVAFGRTVSAALDPVLVPRGFAAGQYGEEVPGPARAPDLVPSDAQVIFCAGAYELSARYPWLPQSAEYDPEHDLCFDFIVGVTQQGTVAYVELEIRSLEATLSAVGRDTDAATAAALQGRPLMDALPVLKELTARLFTPPVG